ncbi:MAG: YfhO family protein, partial [Lachnospiraceae bacterium]|nr:YfhO family protein [Lachnospiraceae bacterium]
TGANSFDELVDGLPNVFVGILPLALAVLFFLHKGIERRKKGEAALLLGIYLLSFWIVAFDMLMHGGTTTNWFNYRYSYVFSFLLLLIAAEAWQQLDTAQARELKRVFVGMLLVTAVVLVKKYEFLKGGAVVLDYALLMLVFLAWRMHQKRPEVNPRRVFEIIALVLVGVNLLVNYRICTGNVLEWAPKLSEYQETVKNLAEYKILNLTGISNTDLKLQYGAANLEVLSLADQRFTTLARTISGWGNYLYDQGDIPEARQVLEFGISCRTDVSANYITLAKIYKESDPERIAALKETAESLNSLTKNSIIERLEEITAS